MKKKLIEPDELQMTKIIPDDNFIWGEGWTQEDIDGIKEWVNEYKNKKEKEQ